MRQRYLLEKSSVCFLEITIGLLAELFLTVKADEVLLQTGAFVGVIATNEGWLVVIVSRANSTRFM